MRTIDYRVARLDDLEKLLPLAIAFAEERAGLAGHELAEGYAEHVRRSLEEVLRSPVAFTVVAEDGDEFAGYATATLQEPPPIFRAPPFAFVSDVYVEPSRRRQGIGAALVERLRGWAYIRGIPRMTAVVPLRSEAARRLGARMGFAPLEELVFWEDK